MADPYDRQFIDAMIAHHEAAIAMAKVALTKAQHPEITTLAKAIIAAQSGEIAKMRGWRKLWYGAAQAPAKSGAGMAKMRGMG